MEISLMDKICVVYAAVRVTVCVCVAGHLFGSSNLIDRSM